MNGLLIGNARVSTSGQELNLQLDALKQVGIPDKLIFLTSYINLCKRNNDGVVPLKMGTTIL